MVAPARAAIHFEIPRYEPPADNAFDHYQRAFELLPGPRMWDEVLRDLDQASVDDAEVAVLEAGSALEELRQGIGKPCLLPPTEGLASPLPYLQDFRSATRLLLVDGWVRARRGESREAFASYHDALVMGQDAARGGALIHKLVSLACESVACKLIRRTVRETTDEAALEALVDSLGTFEEQEVPLSESLAVEYSTTRRTLEAAKDPTAPAPKAGPPIDDGKLRLPPAFADACLAALDVLFDQAVAAAKMDYWRLGATDGVGPAGHPLLEPTVPAIRRTLEKSAANQAALRGTRLVAALGLYFAQRRAYPDTLGKLTPETLKELPIDPCSGEGFRYKLLDPLNYQLYSVGPDRKDDGGAADDLVFSTTEQKPGP
jgi:hypothetical protein